MKYNSVIYQFPTSRLLLSNLVNSSLCTEMMSSCCITSKNTIYSAMNSPHLEIVSAGTAYTFVALEFATLSLCAACFSLYPITVKPV